MATNSETARERIEYADKYGDDAAMERYGLRPETLSRYRRLLAARDKERDMGEYQKIFNKSHPKRWTDHPKLYGDWLILNDLHLPFISMDMLDKALEVADKLNLNQLAVLGDLIDFESISKFDFGGDQYELMDELYIARDYLQEMSKRFDHILFLRGNHDERVIKFLKHVKRMFLKEKSKNEYAAYHAILGVDVSKTPWHQYKAFFESEKVEVSNYAKCEFEGKYIGLHPSNYSRVPPAVERKFCNKYLKHVIGTHGHMSAMGFHDSGQFMAVQFGGLLDKELIFYKNMRETTHPEWVPGFGWIKDKKLGYYFDHPDLMSVFDYIEIGRKLAKGE